MADEQKGTVYVVLRTATRSVTATPEDDDVREVPVPGSFTVVTKEGEPVLFTAANDVAAIKAAEKATGLRFDHGAVAVPARSWRPRVPKDEMVPRRLWS